MQELTTTQMVSAAIRLVVSLIGLAAICVILYRDYIIDREMDRIEQRMNEPQEVTMYVFPEYIYYHPESKEGLIEKITTVHTSRLKGGGAGGGSVIIDRPGGASGRVCPDSPNGKGAIGGNSIPDSTSPIGGGASGPGYVEVRWLPRKNHIPLYEGDTRTNCGENCKCDQPRHEP